MNEKLDTGDTSARKTYIRSIVDAIEVDDRAIRIIGSRDVLQAVIAGKQTANGNVRGFVRKWRARDDSNVRLLPSKRDYLNYQRLPIIATGHLAN